MLIKKSTLAAVVFTAGLLAVTSASAGVDGPYINADLGYGFLHQTSVSGITTSSSSSTGIAGRVDGGFQFGPWFALETGYTKYTNAVIKGYNDPYLINAKTVFDSYSIDIVARASLPLGGGFNVYFKVGPAFLKEIFTVNATYTAAAGPGLAGTQAIFPNTESKVLPEAGIGATYDMSNNFLIDVTWMHIQHIGDNNLRNADFAGVGLTYNLG
jgi:outer membrane immunogenic protein